MKNVLFALVIAWTFISDARVQAQAEVNEVIITRGDGMGFLPLMVMESQKLVEKKAAEAGVKLAAKWVNISGSGTVNDALLSGSAHFISGGVPGMLTLWDRAKGRMDVVGVASISSQPMYLNTTDKNIKSLDDFTEKDRIAVTAVKISIPSITMQMHARTKYGAAETFKFDTSTVAMRHPDGLITLLTRSGGVNAHYTSPPFHQREIKDPGVRTIQTTYDVMGGPTTFAMLVSTKKFRDENPKAFKIVYDALKESQDFINNNRQKSAEILLESMGGQGWTVNELLEVLNDPDIKFDMKPENIMRYADFMHDVGSIKTRMTKWSDLFAPEVHGLPGN
jgi:NitT/TauT family transport system substrate-binding protein